MVTLEQYVGPYAKSTDWTPERQANAERFLARCEALQAEAIASGVVFRVSPKTGSCVGGEGNGGFRPQSCPIGAPGSSHKEGRALDWYDPYNEIDAWCIANIDRLKAHGICIEAPASTPKWSHWTDRTPPSGHTVFIP